jgi:hypothetical protein
MILYHGCSARSGRFIEKGGLPAGCYVTNRREVAERCAWWAAHVNGQRVGALAEVNVTNADLKLESVVRHAGGDECWPLTRDVPAVVRKWVSPTADIKEAGVLPRRGFLLLQDDHDPPKRHASEMELNEKLDEIVERFS